MKDISLALDFNSYAQRAILLSQGLEIGHFVAATSKDPVGWLAQILRRHPKCTLIASPLDHWTSDCTDLLHAANAQVDWLSPVVMRALYHVQRPWDIHRKLHRARLLAYLAKHRPELCELPNALAEFEALAAARILHQADSPT